MASKLINKRLSIKYKLNASVFEQLNADAFAVTQRSLGTGRKSSNEMLAHPTLLNKILPNIIGNSNLNANWEQDKTNYMSSILITVPINGYELVLDFRFDKSDPELGDNIREYIDFNTLYKETRSEDNDKIQKVDTDGKPVFDAEGKPVYKKVKTIVREDLDDKTIINHISSNLSPIDHHKYFRFLNGEHYLYWVMCCLSNQVANNVGDVNKSDKIRFYLHDPLIAQKNVVDATRTKVEALNKLNAIYNSDSKNTIKDLSILLHIVDVRDSDSYGIDDIYILMFDYVSKYPSEFMNIADDEDIQIKSFIRSLLEYSLISQTDDNIFVDSNNPSIILGKSEKEVINYLKSDLNKGEYNRYSNKLKSLK